MSIIIVDLIFVVIFIIMTILIWKTTMMPFIDKNKSIIENMSYIVLIMTLFYGIYQYSFYIWPVWDKQNELDKKSNELIDLNSKLRETRRQIDEMLLKLEQVENDKKELGVQNKIFQDTIIRKQEILENMFTQYTGIENEKKDIEKELEFSYYMSIANDIFNNYLQSSILLEKPFVFKEEINKYCRKELGNNPSRIKKKVLEDFLLFANTMTASDDYKNMYSFIYDHDKL